MFTVYIQNSAGMIRTLFDVEREEHAKAFVDMHGGCWVDDDRTVWKLSYFN